MYKTPHVTTGGRSVSTYGAIQTKSLSITQTTNMLYTAVNIDNESETFVKPKKHNHSATEPRDNNIVCNHIKL